MSLTYSLTEVGQFLDLIDQAVAKVKRTSPANVATAAERGLWATYIKSHEEAGGLARAILNGD